MAHSPKFRHWLALVALTVMWGSAYVLIEVALKSFTPLGLTLLRVVFAAVLMLVLMRAMGHRLPADPVSWAYFTVVGLLGNCIPFYLTGAGQVTLDSGMTGLLLAATPLMVLLLARDEPLAPLRVSGFVVGFGGVALLIGPQWPPLSGGAAGELSGYLMLLAAAFCYALTAVIVRRGPRFAAPVYTTAVMLVATAVLLPPALLGSHISLAVLAGADAGSWLAVAALGAVATGLAGIVYFYVVAEAGAGFQALTNYLIPVWALLLGWAALDERPPSRAYLALAALLLGLFLVNRGGAAASLPRTVR